MNTFNGVKVFSATMYEARDQLGETAGQWIREQLDNPHWKLIDVRVTQSSDSRFHCVAISIFYLDETPPPITKRRLDFKPKG